MKDHAEIGNLTKYDQSRHDLLCGGGVTLSIC